MESDKNLELAEALIGESYAQLAKENLHSLSMKTRNLLAQRRVPDDGMSDLEIEILLGQLAAMDTNNFGDKIGVGEREGRIWSSLVQKRNYYMGHGIGRSGTLNAVQPKAPGSSLLLQLTKALVLDIVRNILSMGFFKDVLIVPSATGISLTLGFLGLAKLKPDAKYVIWPRIDQKTCIKSITAAGLKPIVIEPILDGDAITTNLAAIKEQITKLGVENVLAIFSTTSCFAPRVPDRIDEIAKICKETNLFHIINNAYGLQCTKICSLMTQAHQHGRVDLVIQSTDKNFMVPVGGSFILSADEKILQTVSSIYPGRASMSPIMDLFITFLSMGRTTLVKLFKDRSDNFKYFKQRLKEVVESKGEKLLESPSNKISLAFTVGKIVSVEKFKGNATFLGSFLFRRRVMGARVVAPDKDPEVPSKLEGMMFKNYGSHSETYPHLPYITVACALGASRTELDEFLGMLTKL